MLGAQVNNRVKLLLLTGVLVLPTILVYLAYERFDWRPSGQKNYGELLPPSRIANGAGNWEDGATSWFERTSGKWVLVYVGPSACDEGCRRSLYYLRQVRILQDGERHRIRLAWVLTDAGKVDPALLQTLPGLGLWRPADTAFTRQFPQENPTAWHVYLIDPLGNLILRFPTQPDAQRMEKDIRLLLQASQIG